MRFFRADRGAIFLCNSNGFFPRASVNLNGAASLAAGAAIAERYVHSNGAYAPHIIVKGQQNGSAAFASLPEHGMYAGLCAPFRADGQMVGAIYMDTIFPGKTFPEDSCSLLKTLAAFVTPQLQRLRSAVNNNGAAALSSASTLDDDYDLLNIVGRSPHLQSVLVKVSHVAAMNIPVLVEGESGTGKELIARALHRNSDRRDKPFVAINCGAIPEQLLASELFGYERGAFTGASKSTPGKFEAASNGTLFLDEVSELPPAIQVALLRVLQSGEFFRLGSVTPRTSTARIITATNKHLLDCVKDQTFREDLYYRLNVVRITVPPLRERREDIPLLVAHFLKHIHPLTGKNIHGVSPEAFALLQSYDFYGNVRELENAISYAAVSAATNTIGAEDLPDEIRRGSASAGADRTAVPKTLEEMRAAQERIERAYLERLLADARGNVSAAAKQSGMHRTQLHALFARHGIQPALFRVPKK